MLPRGKNGSIKQGLLPRGLPHMFIYFPVGLSALPVIYRQYRHYPRYRLYWFYRQIIGNTCITDNTGCTVYNGYTGNILEIWHYIGITGYTGSTGNIFAIPAIPTIEALPEILDLMAICWQYWHYQLNCVYTVQAIYWKYQSCIGITGYIGNILAIQVIPEIYQQYR